jgi:hypothetical protein
MNCKPGDLAVIVKSSAGNEGKILRVLRLAVGVRVFLPNFQISNSPVWETDTMLVGCFGGVGNTIEDELLRPIRDNDGEDETLTWAGKPESVSISDLYALSRKSLERQGK